jgi:hypothetical protein
VQPSRVSPQSIILTSPDYKARAATRRPTAPPERVSISVLRERAAAAPVAWAAALEDADEAADAADPDAEEAALLACEEPLCDDPVDSAALPVPVVLPAVVSAGVEESVAEAPAVATPVGVVPLV